MKLRHPFPRFQALLRQLTIHLWMPSLPVPESPHALRLFLNGKIVTIHRD